MANIVQRKTWWAYVLEHVTFYIAYVFYAQRQGAQLDLLSF